MQLGAGARGVALVEDQVEDLHDHAQTFWALPWRRQRERGLGVPQGPLGAADPLGHRGLRDEERPGHLGGRQPADRAQGQRQLGRRRQCRVAAQEEESQRVILLRLSALAPDLHGC